MKKKLIRRFCRRCEKYFKTTNARAKVCEKCVKPKGKWLIELQGGKK